MITIESMFDAERALNDRLEQRIVKLERQLAEATKATAARDVEILEKREYEPHEYRLLQEVQACIAAIKKDHGIE